MYCFVNFTETRNSHYPYCYYIKMTDYPLIKSIHEFRYDALLLVVFTETMHFHYSKLLFQMNSYPGYSWNSEIMYMYDCTINIHCNYEILLFQIHN